MVLAFRKPCGKRVCLVFETLFRLRRAVPCEREWIAMIKTQWIAWLPMLWIAAGPLQGQQAASPTGNAAPPAPAEAFYRKGLAAESAGDPAAAARAYTEALRIQPRHVQARFRLGELRRNAASIAAKGRENRFNAVNLPQVRFQDASLQDSLEALAAMVSRESKEQVAPSFIVQDPKGKLNEAKIQLELRNVPSGAVLRYVLDQAKAKARFDEHAIIITPR